jgi:hypothetical protein
VVSGARSCGGCGLSSCQIRVLHIHSPLAVQMTIGKGKRPRDSNQLAKFIVDLSTGQIPTPDPYQGKDAKKVDAGRRGGLNGGKSRAKSLTADQRTSIAKKAAIARWGEKAND